MKVNAKYVNPFIEAAMKVVSQVAGIEVRRGHLSYKSKVEPSFGVSIIVGIYGYLVGQVVYSLDTALANVSYFYTRDVRESIERAQAMIEPAMILFIAAILGGVMLSVLGPIYDIITKLKT